MKHLFFIFAVCLGTTVWGQKEIDLKKKYFGVYEGVIAGYRVQSDDELLFVKDAPIEITIEEENVFVTIGNNELSGTYYVMFEADKYYLLDVAIDGQLANERIMVYKQGKKLSRDGMFPQPVTRLEKLSNRELKSRKRSLPD